MKPALYVFLLLVPLSLHAAEPIVVKGLEPGKSYLLEVALDGTVTLVPIRTVSPGGTVPTDPGTPPVDPTNPSDFSKAIQTMTKASLDGGGSPTTAAALSSVYSLVADGIKDGSISEANAFIAIKLSTDTVLNNVADKPKWEKWRTDLGSGLELLRQQGVLQLPETFYEVAVGIDLALGKTINPKSIAGLPQAQLATQAKLFENIDLVKLIELIKLILELIKAFRP
jgi:hypothetical protein